MISDELKAVSKPVNFGQSVSSNKPQSQAKPLDNEKPKLETKESGPSELNILNLKNDSRKRKDFYKSSKFNDDILEDDAIILEGSLKHLKIIQDSLSDKLPKIIHYEIFHSIKIFVDQELINALMAEWKQNTMSSKYHVFK